MTPRSDHEEDMSMEEILASIRKFVTDNPPEDPRKQKVYKGDLSGAVVIPPAGHSIQGDYHQEPSPIGAQSLHPTPAHEHQHASRFTEQPLNTPLPQGHPRAPQFEPDILELHSPLPQPSAHEESNRARTAAPTHHAPWTPPSKTPLQRKTLEEAILTLSNPIDSSDFKKEKLPKPTFKSPVSEDITESLVSTQAIAASASSLTRLAQASKSVPKKPSLAEQRNVTLDQLIQDLIRPMIKQWIDTHLPGLVEEMVAKEIKRITKHLE